MPMLIPESLLQKEKDHVEGFAPECAWVTMGGSEELRGAPAASARRPRRCSASTGATSSTPGAICRSCITSGAACCAGRRPPVRSCAAASSSGRRATPCTPPQRRPARRLSSMLECLCRLLRERSWPCRSSRGQQDRQGEVRRRRGHLYDRVHDARPQGPAGAARPTIFGDGFARAFDITFTDKNNQPGQPRTRPPGACPRVMIGGIIMTHGDNNGLVLPPDDRADPGRHHPDRARTRRACSRRQRAVAEHAEGRRPPGEDGRLRAVPRLEVRRVRDEGRAAPSGARPEGHREEPVRAGAAATTAKRASSRWTT